MYLHSDGRLLLRIHPVPYLICTTDNQCMNVMSCVGEMRLHIGHLVVSQIIDAIHLESIQRYPWQPNDLDDVTDLYEVLHLALI